LTQPANRLQPTAAKGTNIIITIDTVLLGFETNLAKHISPSPKGLMRFILLGGYIFVLGLKLPLSSCLVTSLRQRRMWTGGGGL